ncbi:MAG: sulfite exporter TauE/SafE family protein [Granulosicoccus sp.]
MSVEFFVYMALGGIAGGFVNGFAGTGTALFAIGFFLVVAEPKTAVAVVALLAVLSGLQGVWVVRREIIEYKVRLLLFLLPGVVGVPIGIMLLDDLNPAALRILVAALLITYGAYFGLRNALPAIERKMPLVDGSVGLLGGILGGLASLSGALPTIWLSMRPWPKEQTRAVLQPYNMTILSFTVCMLALGGAYNSITFKGLAVALPTGILAAQLGVSVFKKVSDIQFRRVLILLCLGLGIAMLAREIAA